jgi:hypothetical protein
MTVEAEVTIESTPEVPQEETPEQKTVTYEEIASKVGWRPKTDFKGDPGRWTDAETWVATTANLNEGYRHEIKSMKRTIDGMAKTFKSTMEAQYQKGLQEAEEARRESIRVGDVEAVEAHDKYIETIKQSKPQDTEMKPEVQDFIMRNGWFDKDQKMTRRAIVYKDEYFAENPDGSLEDALQYVETEIKKAFSDKFAPRERVVQQPSPVEGAGSRTIGGKIDPVSKIKTFIYSDPE